MRSGRESEATEIDLKRPFESTTLRHLIRPQDALQELHPIVWS